MMPWSSGSCSGVTMWPCMPKRAILSENQYWQNRNPPAMTMITTMLWMTAKRMPMKTAIEKDHEAAR